MNTITPSKVYVSSGAVESLKWLALVSMLIDHTNKALFDSSLAWAIPVGRIAMPLFSLVIAYNLARPTTDSTKLLLRLLGVGLIPTPFHTVLTHGSLLPLNVLFTFALAVGVIKLIDRRQYLIAAALLLGGGLSVDYLYIGVSLVVVATVWFRHPSLSWVGVAALPLGWLCLFNGNTWALLSIPVISIAIWLSPKVPRLRWLFWGFYPLHLAALAALAAFRP